MNDSHKTFGSQLMDAWKEGMDWFYSWVIFPITGFPPPRKDRKEDDKS